MLDDIIGAGRDTGNRPAAGGHVVDQHEWNSLVVRGKNGGAAAVIQRCGITDVAEKNHSVSQAELRDQSLGPRSMRRLASPAEQEVSAPSGIDQPPDGTDQSRLVFLTRKTRDHDDVL